MTKLPGPPPPLPKGREVVPSLPDLEGICWNFDEWLERVLQLPAPPTLKIFADIVLGNSSLTILLFHVLIIGLGMLYF